MSGLPCSKDGIVRVFSCHCGRNLRGEVVQLHGGHASVEAVDDLDRDLGGVNVVHVEAVAQLLDPGGDLVEVHHLLPPVPLHHSHPACLGHLDNCLYVSVTGNKR